MKNTNITCPYCDNNIHIKRNGFYKTQNKIIKIKITNNAIKTQNKITKIKIINNDINVVNVIKHLLYLI
jgi:hypothetical protein